MNKILCEDPHQVVECLRCDGRFLRSDHEDKVCAFCDNDDLQDTIFLMPEEFDRCTCKQCTEIKEGAIHENR